MTSDRSVSVDSSANALPSFSLRGGPVYALQRRLGLIPPHGWRLGRRIGLLVILTWVPMVLWAILKQRFLPGVVADPLLAHFGIHVRCLLAIPLFIAAEPFADSLIAPIIPQCLKTGLVMAGEQERFASIVAATKRWRDSRVAVGVMGAIALIRAASPSVLTQWEDALAWATETASGTTYLGFGGVWFLRVVQPVFIFLLLMWLWRLLLLAVFCWRLAGLKLSLVPTHPDHVGGLGFLEQIPMAFTPIIFALSAVLAGYWSHGVVYHQLPISNLKLPMVGFICAMLVLFLSPLLAFSGHLVRLRRGGVLDYGLLVGQQGRAVRQRWILGQTVDCEALLDVPEIGPVIDANSMYEAVVNTRVVLPGFRSVLSIVLAALLPFSVVIMLEVPVKEILQKLIETLL